MFDDQHLPFKRQVLFARQVQFVYILYIIYITYIIYIIYYVYYVTYILYIQFIYIYIMLYIYILYIQFIYIYISINSRRINYKCILATNSFVCVITIFRLYNLEKHCLMLHLYDR